jgi:hypothetical protein
MMKPSKQPRGPQSGRASVAGLPCEAAWISPKKDFKKNMAQKPEPLKKINDLPIQ